LGSHYFFGSEKTNVALLFIPELIVPKLKLSRLFDEFSLNEILDRTFCDKIYLFIAKISSV